MPIRGYTCRRCGCSTSRSSWSDPDEAEKEGLCWGCYMYPKHTKSLEKKEEFRERDRAVESPIFE
jgi:hypothetical protein